METMLGKPVEELSRIMEVVRCEISRSWSVVASSDSPVSTELPFPKQAVRMLSVSNVVSRVFKRREISTLLSTRF
jgi:hypothetical protein